MSFLLGAWNAEKPLLEKARELLPTVEWEAPKNRGYQTADVTDQMPGYKRAFFLKLPPHTDIHRHVDCGDCKTDHVVIETNNQCTNYWTEGGKEHSTWMEKDCRYTVDRTVEHWAINNGDTDRVHLMLEY